MEVNRVICVQSTFLLASTTNINSTWSSTDINPRRPATAKHVLGTPHSCRLIRRGALTTGNQRPSSVGVSGKKRHFQGGSIGCFEAANCKDFGSSNGQSNDLSGAIELSRKHQVSTLDITGIASSKIKHLPAAGARIFFVFISGRGLFIEAATEVYLVLIHADCVDGSGNVLLGRWMY